ncbi:hypothetical protein B0H13DRAFT_2007970 [Mycena leptocephala]|nr:hypothetical protein B0H13DRAFT_2007970 [Mycena leptocephala]
MMRMEDGMDLRSRVMEGNCTASSYGEREEEDGQRGSRRARVCCSWLRIVRISWMDSTPPSSRDSWCAGAETRAPPCPLHDVSASSPPLGRARPDDERPASATVPGEGDVLVPRRAVYLARSRLRFGASPCSSSSSPHALGVQIARRFAVVEL